jgi:arylsulfatase A-like enzyme
MPNGKPNILVLWGDDIGWWNPSIYNHGSMGYRTPNIDRIGREGALFTDWYGQQSCTAGRAAFLTGQSPIRTGLLKVGLPGAKEGLTAPDPTIADLLKERGYATGQFGKNHVGDRNEHLPTVHGFDEFFGNLYHLNAEEEPEHEDYPSPERFPNFKDRFGPRGVLHTWATDEDDATEDPRFGRVGKQRIEDTGPLTKKRMETADEEFLAGAKDFIGRAHAGDQPFFVWFNTTRMHIFTHLKAESKGVTGLGVYPDGMVEHDGHIGQMLDLLDELGIADDTIVVYSTDNGAEVMTWPDGGTTPFRGEKATNWEGGFRVPMVIRWPGVFEPGTIVNEICAHEDFIPTFLAAAGEPDIVEKCKAGHTVGEITYKVHLDGVNLLPAFKKPPAQHQWPRKLFPYWSDDGDFLAIRYEEWKVVFKEQRAHGLRVWEDPFVELRAPHMFNIRSDPFERGPEGIYYGQFKAEHLFIVVPAAALAAEWLTSFREFPPRMKPGSFNLDRVMEQVTAPAGKN